MSRIYKTLGTVAMTPKGEYDSSAYYEYLNIVVYEGSSYVAKQSAHGILPTNENYWLYLGGGVKIDGGSTGNRPESPVTGQMYFDTTLNKPIWYNGYNWVDAAGNII